MELRRLLLFVIFSFSIVVLWGEANRAPVVATVGVEKMTPSIPQLSSPPLIDAPVSKTKAHSAGVVGELITVVTDTFEVVINSEGGNLQQVSLLNHREANDKDKPIVLLQQKTESTYLAQSGLLGNGLPTHTASFRTNQKEYRLNPESNQLVVDLSYADNNDVRVSKIYTFNRGSYLINVSYTIENKSKETLTPSAYFQLVRDASLPEGASALIPTYTGPAFYTDADKFRKVEFSSIEKQKAELPDSSGDGWVGMLQHYFISAWIPGAGPEREFYARKLDGDLYSAGLVVSVPDIKPSEQATVSTDLYVGPAQSKLDQITPGLGLTVDYGIFTIFAAPLFWLMSFLYGWVGNWGFAIILLTVLIKLVFFPLSAASYRSMAKMRVMAPKLEKIKKQYGDDRERLNKAMMELYKTEKINPLGGCLPVLIQIPVFIGLYWAILESVELRHAPFMGWIIDLSVADPYYILPVIMGLSMLIQTRLNPVPADPMQARIMKIMPIAFSAIFFFFPAGLVLYSIVNNVLSISQQWYITHAAETAQRGAAKS